MCQVLYEVLLHTISHLPVLTTLKITGTMTYIVGHLIGKKTEVWRDLTCPSLTNS